MRFVKRRDYLEDIALFKYRSTAVWYGILMLFLLSIPWIGDIYWTSLTTLTAIYAIVALGMNLLTGYAGQISLGHAAFFAVGAYTSAFLTGTGVSFWVALPTGAVLSALMGIFIGLPALRMKGLYLAIATMGFGFIVEQGIYSWKYVTHGVNGRQLARPSLGPVSFESDTAYFYLVTAVFLIMLLLMKNILRTPTGRAFCAIRDSERAAESMGVNLAIYKTAAFAISAFYAGVAGSLFAHHMMFIGPQNFDVVVSINFLIMIIIGGMGSVHGSVFGAVFVTFLPELIALAKDYIPPVIGQQAGLQGLVYGLLLIFFVLFEPLGLYGRWMKLKFFLESFPYYKKDTFKRARKYTRSEH
jgi:branched-chain amino acid transport system permease protein